MNGITSFPEAILKLTGLNIEAMDQQEVITKAKKLMGKNLRFEALLITSWGLSMLSKKYNHELMDLLEEITMCKIEWSEYKLRKESTPEEFVTKLLQGKDINNLYEIAIKLFVIEGEKQTAAFLFVLLADLYKENDEKYQLIKSIGELYPRFVYYHSLLFFSFRVFLSSMHLNLVEKLVKLMFTKLEHANINRKQLITLYWYFAYLGEEKAAEMIIDYLYQHEDIENRSIDFIENYEWVGYPLELLGEKYDRIAHTKYETSTKPFNEIFHTTTLYGLIPLCLYARTKKDVEVEYIALWYALKKSKSRKLLERMGEISGFQLPKEFCAITLEQRGPWLTNRLHESQWLYEGKKGTKGPPKDFISSCKQAYAVKPFTIEVLRSIFKANRAFPEDKELSGMIQYSINRITSPVVLGKLLSYSITTRNKYANNLILCRLAVLEFYRTIIHAVEKVADYIKVYDSELKEIVLHNIVFYLDIVPLKKQEIERLASVQRHYRFLDENVQESFNKEREQIYEEREIRALAKSKNYNKIYALLQQQKDYSTNALELMLQNGIRSKNLPFVLLGYKKLVEKDSACASLYNSDVAPYMMLYNKFSKTVKGIGMQNLVSKVWATPRILEEPIDRTTRTVVNYMRIVEEKED